jgi:hypothetical protein
MDQCTYPILDSKLDLIHNELLIESFFLKKDQTHDFICLRESLRINCIKTKIGRLRLVIFLVYMVNMNKGIFFGPAISVAKELGPLETRAQVACSNLQSLGT